MSILRTLAELAPTVEPTTAPTTAPTTEGMLLLGVGLCVVALLLAWFAGVFRRRSIEGPQRLPLGIPAAPLFFVTMFGAGVWLFAQVAYFNFRAARFEAANPEVKFSSERLGSFDYAFLSTVPFIVGFAALAIGDRAAARGLVRRVGYSAARIPRGLLAGVAAFPIVFLLMQGGGILLEVLYQAIELKHPPAHELLSAMEQVSPVARAMMVLGACVIVPMFEELLFRGHIQTLCTRLSIAQRNRWMAVLLTSALFAVMHPSWTAPLIFLLSLCIGYTFERTGNLWAAITIHALFNTSSTVVFLYVQ